MSKMPEEYGRKYVREETLTINEPTTLRELVKILESKQRDIERDLGIGIHFQITVAIKEDTPELELNIYKSKGGF